MVEQREFKYAPKFLARRYPIFAELEDNPIYLRESGKKYRKGNLLLDLAKGIAFFLVALLLLAVGLNCCFPVTLPLALVIIHNLSTSKIGNSLFSRRTAEWQAGQLEQLALSSLTGREIIWGFACANLGRRLWFWMPLLILLGTLGLLMSIFVLIFETRPYSPHWEPFLSLFLNIGLSLMVALAFIVQGVLFLFMSSMVSAGRCFEMLGVSLGENTRMFFGAVFRDALVCLGLIIPGAVISGIILIPLSMFFLDFSPGSTSTSEVLLAIVFRFLASATFFLISIPLTWLASRKVYEVCMAQADRDFLQAIQRLEERREEAAGSSIFGE